MAKVTIGNIAAVKSNIVNLFNEIKSNEEMLIEVGNETVRLTKSYLRSGKNPDGTELPELTKSGYKKDKNGKKVWIEAWVDRKESIKGSNDVAKYYKKGKSNLTFTGQLLDAMNITKIFRSTGTVEIKITDVTPRKPYKNKNGSSFSKTPKNTEIYQGLVKKGWDFFGINRQMENVINKIVRKYINLEIKKRFIK